MAFASFSQFLVEEEQAVYFTFGEMNPPTIDHDKLLNKLAAKAGRNPYRVYLSQSQDKNKNPLLYKEKIKYARKMFPKHARQIMVNTKVKKPIDVATVLYDEGFKTIVMTVGSERVNEFEILLQKYNGVKGRHGFYNFKKITVVSAGENPDLESSSKQRGSAKANDFTTFSQGVPKPLSNSDAKKLFSDIRNAMGIKEEASFRHHVELESVSEEREAFVNGDLFSLGDSVIIKESDEVGTISMLGANYLIVDTSKGRTRQWLESVENVSGKVCGHVKEDVAKPDTKYSFASFITEAEYQGRKVKLNDPFRTPKANKEYGVYVRNDNSDVTLVRFGDNYMQEGTNLPPPNKWEERYWSTRHGRKSARPKQ